MSANGCRLCAINLSGQSLGDDKFLPFVIEQFQKSGLDPRKICFEITETSAVASFSQANRFINSLKDLGCQFALDDFGTGLSSFGYLKHFPVDFLKIDGSFVRGILTDPIDREMVRSINEIGHLTGKLVIAEFAENQEIIEALRALGVDYAQGYAIAQPSRLSKNPPRHRAVKRWRWRNGPRSVKSQRQVDGAQVLGQRTHRYVVDARCGNRPDAAQVHAARGLEPGRAAPGVTLGHGGLHVAGREFVEHDDVRLHRPAPRGIPRATRPRFPPECPAPPRGRCGWPPRSTPRR